MDHGRLKTRPIQAWRRSGESTGTTTSSSQVPKKVGPYYYEGRKLMKDNPIKGEPPMAVSRHVAIKEKKLDIDTGKITIMLEYDYHEKTFTREIPRGMLTKSKLTALLDYGVDVSDHKANDVLIFLNKQEELAPLTMAHSGIGWGKHEGERIFRAWEAIGCNSKYSGPLKLEPKGTLDGSLGVSRQHVLGNTPMEFAFTLGLAAPVNSLIAKYTGIETILVHLHGDSSQGKTTAARVAVSSFGLPHTTEGGLIKHWNGTRNAILGHFRNDFGIPMVLDEASMNASEDFSSLIYVLASGTDKARMTSESEMRKPAEWSGVILSTAEHSLQGKSKQNTGIKMRIYEIGNVPWTKSAQHADAIKQGFLNNYGHVGPKFAEYLLRIGEEAVHELWMMWKKRCVVQMPGDDRFSSRVADKLAVFLVTADMARKALGLDLNVEGMFQWLLELNTEASQERDIGLNALQRLVEIATQHHSKFETPEDTERGFELWGKFENRKGGLYRINILPSKLEEILSKEGFEDSRTVLRNWRDRGWLDHDSGKFTRKVSLRGERIPVNTVRVDSLLEEKPDVTKQRRRKGTNTVTADTGYEEVRDINEMD